MPAAAPIYVQIALHKELATLGSRGSRDPGEVFTVFWRHCELFAPGVADIDACFHALVECRPGSGPEYGRHLLRLLECLDTTLVQSKQLTNEDFRSLTTSAWALARLARQHPALPAEVLARLPAAFAKLEAASLPWLGECFTPRNLALMAWSFAKAGAGSQAFFEALGDAALSRSEQMQPREISNMCWAFATVKMRHRLLKKTAGRLAVVGEEGMRGFSQQDLTCCAWALATLQVRQPEVFAQLAGTAKARANELSVQGIVNLTWAFAAVGSRADFAPTLMERLNSERRWERLEPRGCAMLLWSLTKLRYDDRATELFYLSLADRFIVPRAQLFQAQDTANCLWAFATSRFQHHAVFTTLAQRAAEIVQSFNPQGLANSVWSCAKMQVRAPRLFEAAEALAVQRQLRGWPPHSIATLCWACSEVGRKPVALLAPLGAELGARGGAFNDVDLATLAFVLGPEEGWPQELQALRRATLARIADEGRKRSLPRTREALAVSRLIASVGPETS